MLKRYISESFAFIFTTLLFGALIGCGQRSEPVKREKPQSQPGYTLTQRQKNVAAALIQEDLNVFAVGGDSLLRKAKWQDGSVVTTASKMQEDYEKNEVAADNAYMKKHVLLTATVRSIDRSIGNNYFLKLSGGSNMFISPHAQMADGYAAYLATLEKGQKIVLSCVGNGMLMGSATLGECKPLDVWVSQETQKMVSSLSEKVKQKDKVATQMTLLAIVVESAIPKSSKCNAVVGSECAAEVIKTTDKMMGKSLKPEMIAAAKRIGIDFEVVSGK